MIKITALQNQLPTVTKRYVAHIADRQHTGEYTMCIGTSPNDKDIKEGRLSERITIQQ